MFSWVNYKLDEKHWFLQSLQPKCENINCLTQEKKFHSCFLRLDSLTCRDLCWERKLFCTSSVRTYYKGFWCQASKRTRYSQNILLAKNRGHTWTNMTLHGKQPEKNMISMITEFLSRNKIRWCLERYLGGLLYVTRKTWLIYLLSKLLDFGLSL